MTRVELVSMILLAWSASGCAPDHDQVAGEGGEPASPATSELGTEPPPADGHIAPCWRDPTVAMITGYLTHGGNAVATVASFEVSSPRETRETVLEDETHIDTVYPVILRGTVPVSAPTIPEPWFVVDPAANVRRTPDGRIFRMAPGPEDPHHPYSVARRAMAGPFLLIAIPFHGEGLLVQALPIEGSDVLGVGSGLP